MSGFVRRFPRVLRDRSPGSVYESCRDVSMASSSRVGIWCRSTAGAAGVPLPDPPTRRVFIDALTEEAAGSHEWTVRQLEGITTAGIVGVSGPTFYRLAASCNAGSHYGEMQLSWSPVSKTGTLFASTDGKAPVLTRWKARKRWATGLLG
jgi:hypothetical protein